jgi:hypothetical protein
MVMLKKESLKHLVPASGRSGAIFILLVVAIIMASLSGLSEGATPSPGMTLETSPSYIYAGLPAEIRAVATLSSDATLVPSSVSLNALGADDKLTYIADLYDDATHGDAIANDNIFVNVLRSEETQPRTIRYQVSAYYGNVQKFSPIVYLVVKPNPNLEGSWAGFVDKMVNRNLSGALLYFREGRRAEYRTSYETVGIDNLSNAFQTARNLSCYRIYMGEAEFTFSITINSRDYIGTMVFYLESDGAWRIDGVSFK